MSDSKFYIERRIRHAKAKHICHICGLEINLGETYNRETGVHGGEFFTRCTCMPCYRIRDAYIEDVGETHYCNAIIQDFLLDTFCCKCADFRKCEYTKKQWDEEPWLCPKVRDYYKNSYVDKEVET